MITDGKPRLRFRYKPDLGPLEDIFRFTPYLTPHEKTVLEFITIVILKSGAGRVAHYLTNDKIQNGYGDTPGTGISHYSIVKAVTKLVHLGIIELWVDRTERNNPKNYFVLMYDEPHQDDSRWWEEFTRVTVVEKDGKLIRIMKESRGLNDSPRGLKDRARALKDSPNSITHYIRNTHQVSITRKTRNTHSGRLPTAAPQSEEKPPKLKSKFTVEDLALGRRLYSLLRSHGKRPGNQQQRTLAEPFRLMREVDEIPVEEIEATLDWYSKNFSNKFTPRCYTSEQFRQKYQSIRDAMERPVVVDLASVKPSKETRQIVDDQIDRNWSHADRDNVYAVAELSQRRYTEFRKKALKRSSNFTQRRILENLYPQYFTDLWMQFVHNQTKNWKNFNGNLSKFVWEPDAPGTKTILEVAGFYCEDEWDVWKDLVKLTESTEHENYVLQ